MSVAFKILPDSASKYFTLRHTLPGTTVRLVWAPGGHILASNIETLDFKTIGFWDSQTAKVLGTIGQYGERFAWSTNGHLAFIARGPHLASLLFWDLQNGQPFSSIEIGKYDPITIFDWSPDGRTIAISCLESKYIQMWSWNSLKQKYQHYFNLTGATNSITSLAWSSDGHFLTASSLDWAIHLWSMPDGKYLQSLKGHTGNISTMAWSSGLTLESVLALAIMSYCSRNCSIVMLRGYLSLSRTKPRD